jgi:hypothetical protein
MMNTRPDEIGGWLGGRPALAEWDQILFVKPPDVYHRLPDSGDLQYKSKGLEKAICDHGASWWPHSG